MENEQFPFLKAASLKCSDVEELIDCYLDGEMITPLVERYKAHLEECESCRDMIDDCRHLVRFARTLDETRSIPEDVQSRLRIVLKQEVGFESSRNKPKLSLVK